MEKEFVPYELAVKLKELGFDEPCLFAFDNCSTPMRCSDLRTNEQQFNGVNYNSSTYTSQPTFSQAFRWFRGKYNLREQYGVFPHHTIITNYIIDGGNEEEAEIECLKKLIEIVKEKKI